MVISIQEVSWDFTILDGCVAILFSDTYYLFCPLGHLLKMWCYSALPEKNLYEEIACLDHVTLPYWPAFAWSLTRWLSRAGSLWLSEGRYQEHRRGLHAPSLESFECGTQIYFFFAISQYILIINPHYLCLPECLFSFSANRKIIHKTVLPFISPTIWCLSDILVVNIFS